MHLQFSLPKKILNREFFPYGLESLLSLKVFSTILTRFTNFFFQRYLFGLQTLVNSNQFLFLAGRFLSHLYCKWKKIQFLKQPQFIRFKIQDFCESKFDKKDNELHFEFLFRTLVYFFWKSLVNKLKIIIDTKIFLQQNFQANQHHRTLFIIILYQHHDALLNSCVTKFVH